MDEFSKMLLIIYRLHVWPVPSGKGQDGGLLSGFRKLQILCYGGTTIKIRKFHILLKRPSLESEVGSNGLAFIFPPC